jgi:hypothetical protein
VVSALLLSITYQTAINPIASRSSSHNLVLRIANILGVLSMLLSLSIIVLTALFVVEVIQFAGFGF